MSNLIRFTASRRTARATLHAIWLAGGKLRAYTAPVPANNGAITTQSLLAIYEIPNPAGAVVDGVFTADPILPAINLADGDIAFCRAEDAAGVPIGDYDAGIVGSGQAIEVDNIHFVAGSLSTITSFVIDEG